VNGIGPKAGSVSSSPKSDACRPKSNKTVSIAEQCAEPPFASWLHGVCFFSFNCGGTSSKPCQLGASLQCAPGSKYKTPP
jgi:hypothetical protein